VDATPIEAVSVALPESPEPPQEISPRTGVEIVSVEERGGVNYYTVRDLRNGNVVKNVTQKSARKLWHQAITRFDKLPSDLAHADFQWQGDFGIMEKSKLGKSMRYDLIQRVADGYRYYFGVTEDGIHGVWRQMVGLEE
jgi:hypothetical protein